MSTIRQSICFFAVLTGIGLASSSLIIISCFMGYVIRTQTLFPLLFWPVDLGHIFGYGDIKILKRQHLRFTSEMYKGFKREAGKAADKVVETGKKAVDAVSAPSIPEKARLMAAAFSTSYDRYKSLFGEDGVPLTKRKVMVPKTRSFEKGHPPVVLEEDASGAYVVELHPAPIKVYIDPRYNTSGAKYRLVSGNITMPSTYASDLESTCAHELFHAVQHKQLGIEQAIMGNRLKDYANAAAGGDGETHKYFSNNKWFLEATAEYAARFIGISVGVGGGLWTTA